MKMLKNGRANGHGPLHYNGCSCCNSPSRRRAAKKSLKAKEKNQWNRDFLRGMA